MSEKSIFRKLFAALSCVTLLALGGCNTVRGIGQDIEKGGEAIQKAVK